eukprot:Blabericola_migrator_1__7125@NODE_3609_length_1640_cov_157_390973_g2104_i2_p1_GENE_NODE_3609_length_1640_cov_157_390973_g2104_i2NODE_3609_length_1640_cov_157_390973_g2104_i2_p1_ORF_typecomplete_len360_score33_61_NODE_3609_length_1640_cov_157_390973_g2104_i22701349
MSDSFVVLKEEEWAAEQQRLLNQTPKTFTSDQPHDTIWSLIGAGHTTPENETVWEYVFSLPYSLTEVRSVRGKQARLTVWEALELFDMFNDLNFLWRVGAAIHGWKYHGTAEEISKLPISYVAITWLTCIYIISLVAYCTRRWWLYHRIPSTDYQYFIPFLSLNKIRLAGLESRASLATLFMFERLVWTYQVVMRLIEDVPQVVVSTVYMANIGKDPYIYFMIAYSLIMIVVTSYRMGSEFPLMRTFTLLFSRTPPVDSPILAEGTPLRRHFALVIAFSESKTSLSKHRSTDCLAWSLTHYICVRLVSNKIWRVCKVIDVWDPIMPLLISLKSRLHCLPDAGHSGHMSMGLFDVTCRKR